MKINWYNLALLPLRAAIYIKRFVFWFLGLVWVFLISLNRLYLRTFGFYIYRAIERTKKRLQKIFLTKQHEGLLDFFGRRGVLQALLFIAALGVMFPQSRLYSRAYDEIPGRNTLLYALVGPGDQAYDLEEIVGNSDVLNTASTETWRQVAVNSGDSTQSRGRVPIELTGVAVGGSAIMKPVIMAGVDIGLIDPDQTTQTGLNRTEITTYEVESGDVLGTIATKFGLKTDTILSANNLTTRSYIRPGQKLIILPVDGVVHVVVKGDTLLKIAHKYNAAVSDITKFNNLEENVLTVGDQLIIPGGVNPQPPRIIVSNPSSKGAPAQNQKIGGYLPVNLGDSDAIDKVDAPPPPSASSGESGYIWPTAAKIITQYFGLQHTGVDIAGPVGLPIYATKAGTVVTSQCGWNGGYGCYIKIDHGGGVVSWYGHASKMFVEVGDVVSQGETIALIGVTGRTTGPHLHFEIRVNNKYQNPLSYVRK